MSVDGKMVRFQGLADGNGEDWGEDDGDGDVECRGGQLADDSQQGGIGGQTADKQTAVEVALRQIQHRIGQSADGGGDEGFCVAVVLLAKVDDQTCCQTVGTLHDEGEPALGYVEGIHDIIEGGAKTCCHTAQPGTQQNAGQSAEDVAQMERGGTGNLQRHGDPQGGADEGQGSHKSCDDNFLCG